MIQKTADAILSSYTQTRRTKEELLQIPVIRKTKKLKLRITAELVYPQRPKHTNGSKTTSLRDSKKSKGLNQLHSLSFVEKKEKFALFL